MALNIVFIVFFVIAFLSGLYQYLVLGNQDVWKSLVEATFSMSKTGFEISLGLTGAMTLWLGLMKLGEKGGLIQLFSTLVSPFFSRLFPELPKDHPVFGHIIMNFSANMLGLDNAATPMGLKAMQGLQELNDEKETASNSQIMFLVLNTSGLTLIPISIMVYRAQLGAKDPSDVFIPILLSTFFSTMAGLVAVALVQKINLFKPVLLAYLLGLSLFISLTVFYFLGLTNEETERQSSLFANLILFSIIVLFVVYPLSKKINVYEVFIEGAKEGFQTSISIVPYLVAILVAIGVFRASGAMDVLMEAVKSLVLVFQGDVRFAEALPVAIMKPLSGSGARGLMVDAMQTHGADSFTGRLACCFQGSTDTTFYILAVYFGSVGIKKTRYALACGLFADLVGIIAAIVFCYLFFG